MSDHEIEIYKWTIRNWKRLSKRAESFNKYSKPVPISTQLHERFLIYPKTAAKIANDVALWMHIKKELNK